MIGDTSYKIVASREPWDGIIKIRYGIVTEGGPIRVATVYEFIEVKPFTEVPPLLTLDTHSAQILCDQLWECGIRPTNGSGSAGAMAATERHLHDLQRLVFKDKK